MSVNTMSIMNINTVTQHEVWFAWRGYLVLRPRRARPVPAPRHPAWIYLGRSEYVLPAQLSSVIAPHTGAASGLLRPEGYR
jgi:hypothetical protein